MGTLDAEGGKERERERIEKQQQKPQHNQPYKIIQEVQYEQTKIDDRNNNGENNEQDNNQVSQLVEVED